VPRTVVEAVEGAWGVVNLAGTLDQSGVQSFRALHVDAALSIASASAKAGVEALVHVSSIGADPHAPSRYLASKGEGEHLVRAQFPRAIILRPSAVFGPEDDFFNRLAGYARMLPALPLFSGGHNRIQPVYAGDVGAAVARAIGDPACAGKTFELGGPRSYTMRELTQEVLRVTERERPLISVPMFVAKAIAIASSPIPQFLMKPFVTLDQVKMLQSDLLVDPHADGLARLGVAPTAIETVLPTYLWRFRKAGQFERTSVA
jgi:uncharacterized protein YbjT (DUF2867 family)